MNCGTAHVKVSVLRSVSWRNKPFAGEVLQTSSFHSLGGSSRVEPDEFCAKSGELDIARAVAREVEAEKALLEFCICLRKVHHD